MSKEEYLKTRPKITANYLSLPEYSSSVEYSNPVYRCDKCGGGMCKNLWHGVTVATIPPISQSVFRCDTCGYIETIDD